MWSYLEIKAERGWDLVYEISVKDPFYVTCASEKSTPDIQLGVLGFKSQFSRNQNQENLKKKKNFLLTEHIEGSWYGIPPMGP